MLQIPYSLFRESERFAWDFGDVVSGVLGFLGLAAACYSLYRQFFYRFDSLRISAMPDREGASREKSLIVVLTNAGTSPFAITRMKIVSQNRANGGPIKRPIEFRNLQLPVTLPAGTHLVFSVFFPEIKTGLEGVQTMRSDSSFEKGGERSVAYVFNHSLWVEVFDASGNLAGGTRLIGEEEILANQKGDMLAAYHVTEDLVERRSRFTQYFQRQKILRTRKKR